MHHPARILVLLVLLVLLVQCPPARAASLSAAPSATCNLAVPPPNAGIDRHAGMLLKIYPRTPDIGTGYAGCQTLWARADDGWETITVLHYERGHVVRVASPAQPGDPIEQCRVRDGAVVQGDPGLCAQLDDMRFESLPPECEDDARAPRCQRQ
jgi:hypothetical protein